VRHPSEQIVKELPYLRRYARALTGSQERGDRYVRTCLEALLAEPERLEGEESLRIGLFRVFHDVWRTVDAVVAEDAAGPRDDAARVERGLAALPSQERQVLLLVSLEGFSLRDAAHILGLTEEQTVRALEAARADIRRQASTRVLIIEDEPLIAMDIAQIVLDMGHTVCATAARKDEALVAAREQRPGLVLADVQLQEGDSGIEAVREILRAIDVPVVFVTGFPERLLTGEALEPAFLVTKPFDAETLKAAIGQALSV
jgi:CheY-like chemotaxis protein